MLEMFLAHDHWYSIQAKQEIRALIPQGLTEPAHRVRSSVAYAVSAIAQWDWPEAWCVAHVLRFNHLSYVVVCLNDQWLVYRLKN